MTTTSMPQASVSRKVRRPWLIILASVLGTILLAAMIFAVMMIRMMNAPVPTNLDLNRTRLTEQGVYRTTITSRLEPIAINTIHAWVIRVETPNGQPVENAQITVDGGMPQHGHGLPTQPKVTRYLGNGDYLVEGMKFNMPGWWEFKFQIDANQRVDKITFNLVLQ